MKKVKNIESNNTEKLKNFAKKSKPNFNKKENSAQKIVKKENSTVTVVKKEEIGKKIIELDAKVLAKIEKKKAKKLAKKLKKKELKEKPATGQKTIKIEQKIQQKKTVAKEIPKQNGQKKDEKNKPPKDQKDQKELTAENALEKPIKQEEVKEPQKKGQQKKTQNKSTGQKKNKKNKAAKEFEDEKERAPRDPLLAAATVFVGNLPTTTKRVQIIKLFAKYGAIKAIRLRTASGQVIFKHKQRKEAGSLNAYVVLNDVEAAKKALELNGTEFKGSHLRITPADAQKTQSGHDAKRTLFVGNLKYTANEKKLHEIFSNCGEIDYIRCLGNGKNGCNGVAYVCFKSPEAVGLGLELNETLLDERPIHVERYSVKKLGAQAARNKQAAMAQKQKTTGAKKRIDAKQQKSGKPDNSIERKKKSDYHGVKASGVNKKKHNKKPNNEMRGLAKKIAPKIKKEEKS